MNFLVKEDSSSESLAVALEARRTKKEETNELEAGKRKEDETDDLEAGKRKEEETNGLEAGKRKEEETNEGEEQGKENTSSEELPPIQVRKEELIRATPKLGKILGTTSPASTRGSYTPAPSLRDVPRRRSNSSVSADTSPALPAKFHTVRGMETEVSPRPGNNMSKISKFFGTHISQDTASALSKSQAVEEEGIQTRHRRSSSVGMEEASWTREKSPRDNTPPSHTSPREQVGGRLSLTLFKPSGLLKGDKFHFEVYVDFVLVYKSPPMERKKPEWWCNICVDASMDSLLMVKLFKSKDSNPRMCQIKLNDVQLGIDRSVSMEYPEGGERQQVQLLPLNFGGMPANAQDKGKSYGVDAPHVCDVVVEGLYDLPLLKSAIVVQLRYSEQCMRSDKLLVPAEAAQLTGLQLDATFRLCAGAPVLRVSVCGGDGLEVMCRGKVTLDRLLNNHHERTRGLLLPLVLPHSHRIVAFVRLKLSLSSVHGGLLRHLGQPLNGIPLRCDWGDVVLFNNPKSLNSNIVSAATASSWDHVGIVFEEDGRLSLLEAVAGGVQQTELSSRLYDAVSTHHCKLGLRRYCGPRTPEVRAELWTFAVAMTGRSYKKSVGQLVGSRWGRNKTDDLSSVFCSELVAAAFKHIQQLPPHLITSNVLPKDIASPDFVLVKGSLGPLILYTPKIHNLASSRFSHTSDNDDDDVSM